ncbi:MAG TPA: hypothetical protein VIC35_13115 [Acidimicrobiia bacterium]
MVRSLTRIGLVLLGIPAIVIGIWGAFTPRSFYDDFPGLGHVWVAQVGPYNEHLVRDVGSLYLAMAIVTIAAAVTLSVVLTRWVLVAWLVQGVLHVVYHARHLGPFSTGDQVSMIASLALVPIVAGGLLLADWGSRRAVS